MIVKHWHYSACFAALETVINAPKAEDAAADKASGGFWSKLKAAAKAKVVTALAGHIDAVAQRATAAAMNAAYNLAEKAGIVDAINKASLIFKPGMSAAMIENALSDMMSKTYADRAYFNEQRQLQSTDIQASGYFKDKGKVTDTTNAGATQYKKRLE